MIWFNKAKKWIEVHKNWLALMVMFVLSYLLGKKANKNYLEMAKLTRDQYKKDNEELIRQQELKKLRDNTAKRKANKARKSLEDEKARKIKDLENKTSNIDDIFQGIGIDKK
jgi:NAD-dependent SIR2 family protein deacetylase